MIKRADQKKKLKEQTVSKIFQTNAQKFSHGFKIKVWHKFRNLLNSWSLHLLKTSYSPPPPHLLLNQKKSLTNAILVQCLYNGLLQWFFFDWLIQWLIDGCIPSRKWKATISELLLYSTLGYGLSFVPKNTQNKFNLIITITNTHMTTHLPYPW